MFGTQTYRIVSGNVANAFRLISHREKDDILYLDLQVNGILDRETLANYNLVIEALDGGQPPLKDQLLVKIAILDHNDCEPIFSQNHYYGSVSENVTLGSSILKVTATDNDDGDNGRVIYMLHMKQANNPSSSSSSSAAMKGGNMMDSSSYFAINRHTGWIYVIKPLDYESQDLHELVIIARDQGVQPLETSAFVSIRVTDINDNQPTVNILYLTSNSKPEISEAAKIGDLVARVSVNDADIHATSHSSSFMKKSSSKRYSPYNGLSVSLFGASNGEFGLKTADQIVYLIVVTGKLDRERQSKYQLTVMVSDKGYPPQNTSTTFEIEVTDVNDNAPYFDQHVYHTTLFESADIGSK
ncbi:Cadherin domain containing protein, partial [Euroglyphus maynei]